MALDQKEVVQMLKDGIAAVRSSEEWAAHLEAQAKFWSYSFCNQWLINFQSRGQASRVAGFNKWKELGRHVKKGEKGLAILAPTLYRQKPSEDQQAAAKAEGRDLAPAFALTGFRVVYVFDIAQTEGADLPTCYHPLKGDDGGILAGLSALATERGLEVSEDPEKATSGAEGYMSRKKMIIWLKPGQEAKQKAAVFVHELAHFLLGHGGEGDKTPRHIQELEAESAAYIVFKALSMDSGQASFAYLAGWGGEELKGEVLEAAGNRAARVSKEILGALGKSESLSLETAAA